MATSSPLDIGHFAVVLGLFHWHGSDKSESHTALLQHADKDDEEAAGVGSVQEG